jgi:hypothetical protein
MVEQQPDAQELAFLRELEKYVNKWVAILNYGSDEEAVVASGESIIDARREAESKGFQEVTFFKVPSGERIFVPLMQMCAGLDLEPTSVPL